MLNQVTASMVPSLWSSLASWFTPTILFLFLNLTIATIAISSKLNKHNQNPENNDENNNNNNNNNTRDQQQQQHEQRSPFGRSPSNVLYRLKSINLYSRDNNNTTLDQQNPVLGGSPSNLLRRLKSINFCNSKPEEDLTRQEQEQPSLSRSPSVLHRLKSINLYSYFSPDHHLVSGASPPSATQETVTHFSSRQEEDEDSESESESSDLGESDDQVEDDLGDRSLDEVYSKLQVKRQPTLVTRSKSDTKPASGDVPTKLPKKMRKSASTKSAFSHFQLESDAVAMEARRPATTREQGLKGKKAGGDDDQEVDAKADDFINRFKQQLKLQRLDSIIRYKEMLGRATGK